MKTSNVSSILFLLVFISTQNYPQGEAAVPFLLLNPSPSQSAMGATGTALPTDDPFAFLWNPAQLGLTSQTNNLSFIFYPSKLEWIPTFNLDLELKAIALNAGYNFKDLIGFPLSFGFGYSNPEFDFGTFVRTDENGNILGEFEARDYYNAYSFGLGVDYFVQLSVGYTIKDVNSFLVDDPVDSLDIKAETSVNDFGTLLNVPVLKLIDDKMNVRLNDELTAFPTFNFSLGFSKSNIGEEISYIDPAQADPLPRTDRLGYGISTGFDLVSGNFKIIAFNLSFTVEADDILIKRESMSSDWEYQPTLSDLKFWKNIVQIEGNEKIITRTGTRLDFAETFSYTFGHFSGRGYPDLQKTNGYEFRLKGLLKLYALWAKHPITDFLRDHFDIKYYNTNYFADAWNETKITGLAFYVHNLNELFE